MEHLVSCDNTGKSGERFLDKILLGTKTMIVRDTAGRKTPHSRVFEGENLFFMEKGTAKITAKAVVKSVQNCARLTDEEIHKVFAENGQKINLFDKQKE